MTIIRLQVLRDGEDPEVHWFIDETFTLAIRRRDQLQAEYALYDYKIDMYTNQVPWYEYQELKVRVKNLSRDVSKTRKLVTNLQRRLAIEEGP